MRASSKTFIVEEVDVFPTLQELKWEYYTPTRGGNAVNTVLFQGIFLKSLGRGLFLFQK